MRRPFCFRASALAGLLLLAAIALAPAAGSAARIVWKPVGDAILKVTGAKPPKTWNVFRDSKRKDRLLIELGTRYLVLDARTREVYELDPAQVRPHGNAVQSPDPAKSEKPLATAEWGKRDIGPAERFRVRLINEGLQLDVQLPHPLRLHTAY